MTVRIEHVGVWVRDIDAVTVFYGKYFGAHVGALYQNPRKGFESRFLDVFFGSTPGIMRRHDVSQRAPEEQLGLAHVALVVGDEAASMQLAARFVADGLPPDSGPRRTGDGYYECVVRDPEGNRVEIAAG